MIERTVFVHLPGDVHAVPAGRLELLEEGTEVVGSAFFYGRRYLERKNALAIDPASLDLESEDLERVPVNRLPLFGALRDAAPDAWGRRVIESRLGAPPNGLPESVYLDEAGPHRAGALDVRATPTSAEAPGALPSTLRLHYLVEAAERIEAGLPVPTHLQELFEAGTSMGGARPKAVVVDQDVQWIAKFPAPRDPFDIPAVERATLELARRAGLDVPETRWTTLADGRGVMLIRRFDRASAGNGTARVHMVSALTLLGLSERQSMSAAYADIADAIGRYGASGHVARDRAELFARMVFNILVSNDDDHLRNHAFLQPVAREGWRLSPLYDVVPKAQVGLERRLHLGVGPRGRSARLDHAMQGAARFGLMPAAAARIIEGIVAATREWRTVFEAEGVSDVDCDRIATAFPRAADIGLREVEKHLKG